jgi:hypothetical protein
MRSISLHGNPIKFVIRTKDALKLGNIFNYATDCIFICLKPSKYHFFILKLLCKRLK